MNTKNFDCNIIGITVSILLVWTKRSFLYTNGMNLSIKGELSYTLLCSVLV